MRFINLSLAMCVILFFPVAAIADRPIYRWIDLVETAEFIATAQITKVEKVSPVHFRTTFSVIHVYKGNPPETVPVDWTLGQEDQITTIDGVLDRYILFAKKTGGKYSLEHERFMKKEKDDWISPSSLFFLDPRSVPPELESRIQIEEIKQGNLVYRLRKIKWSDIIHWLETYFNEKRKEELTKP